MRIQFSSSSHIHKKSINYALRYCLIHMKDAPTITATTSGTFLISCNGKADGISCTISTSSPSVGDYIIRNCKPSTGWFVRGEISMWSISNNNGGAYCGIDMDVGDIEDGFDSQVDENTFTSRQRKQDKTKVLGMATTKMEQEFGSYMLQLMMEKILNGAIQVPMLIYQRNWQKEIVALIKENYDKAQRTLDADMLKVVTEHQ
ncbi:unnamed protein product [Absidia cylindrospora]